ncbi:pyrimidine reductase family protein [Streptomyces litchfieldiae]|uniref:Pyrimidine reductase family protein n=1 Tax=Streptomyces litchfieldiae TaxID=3075543 RepID=A0ABU2MR90_9ACTN|nr:pyrimidine reductase family protein [Streptomyces sp. DSM 44938]MDT0344147.1 pyrimidine reductase family protein [Streptomyces sp. DSM 44938]
MRRLFPQQTAPGDDREWALSELADAYAYPTEGLLPDGWLRANMVASADGAAHHGGRSRPLSGPADMRVFGVLRALADVVIVGAETVREERYRPARRRAEFTERRLAAGQTTVPAIAVVSASLHLDFSLPLFTEPEVPTLVLTGAKAPRAGLAAARAAGAEVVVAGDEAGVDPSRVRRELAGRGFTRLLTEGGPRLLGLFATAGVVDELCLTTSPRITVGTAPRVMSGPEIDAPQEFALTDLLEDGGFLFGRYRRARQDTE